MLIVVKVTKDNETGSGRLWNPPLLGEPYWVMTKESPLFGDILIFTL